MIIFIILSIFSSLICLFLHEMKKYYIIEASLFRDCKIIASKTPPTEKHREIAKEHYNRIKEAINGK